MDSTAYYHIAFEPHDIMNPLSEDVLQLIGWHCFRRGGRVLDIGSGKGYVSLFFARQFDAYCVQVDASEKWTAEARRLFAVEELSQSTEIHCADAASFPVAGGDYDMMLCLGTAPIFGGFPEALDCLLPGLAMDGVLVVGELSADGPLPAAFRRIIAEQDWLILSMKEIRRAIARRGVEMIACYRSDAREWDRYMSLQWNAVSDYARRHPGDVQAREFLAWAAKEQDMYLRFQRQHVDWNVAVLRRAPAVSGR